MTRREHHPSSRGRTPGRQGSHTRREESPGSPPYEFVIVSDEDFERAAPLIRVAEREGHRLWVPQRSVRSESVVEKAMNAASGIVVFYSSQTQQSAKTTVDLALHGDKPLSVVFLDGPADGAHRRAANANDRPVRGRRVSLLRTGVNAFAAGTVALFGLAFMNLSGGPPTRQEIQEVSARAKALVRSQHDAQPSMVAR